jgi:sulfate permease, SulP family
VVKPAEEAEPEVDQPGLSRLREAVANRVLELPGRSSLRDDGLAALNSAVASVPDGLASGLLAGVNPIYGLYACMAGPIAGGLFSSTQLLIVATTSASSLAAGQALGGLSSPARDNSLFVMVLLIGAFQILFGLLRFGRLARFVSYSVMTGFLTGIAVLTVLSQLPTVTGYEATGSNRVAATLDLLLNLGQVDPLTVAISGFTLALALLLPRTRLGNFGNLVAIILPSLVAVLFSLESVQVVQDVGEIPRGLPTPFIPSLSLISLDVITGALAVAVIVLIQGAGVSQSVPNPDGSRTRASRDFIAQGAANVASGLFRGLPVGGSLSTTALSVLSGARTRWAAIFAGLWMAAVVVALSGVVAQIAMPALAVLLIVASASAIKPAEVRSIWNTGWPPRLAIVTTFLATLFLPIQVAVGIGVVLSAVLYLYTSSADISVVELVERPDGRIEERKPPKQLRSNALTVLDVYGHLFYAGARTLARLLPKPGDAENPVVILRLRGRTTVGATLIDELSAYADQLAEAKGRLYLTGLSEDVYDQMERTGKLREADPVHAYKATPVVGESTHRAYVDAQTWLVGTSAPADATTNGDSSHAVERSGETP